MSIALNRMLDKFHKSIEQLAGSTSQVTAASEELTDMTTKSSHSLEQQLHKADQAATAMTQMSSTVFRGGRSGRG